jgi:hypothetical protein
MSKEDEMLEELKRIRKLLEPKPAPPPPKDLWNEFVDFLSKYKVMGIAVAFINRHISRRVSSSLGKRSYHADNPVDPWYGQVG